MIQHGYRAKRIPLPTHLLVSRRVSDIAGLGGVEGYCSDTGYMSSGREGATPLM